MEGWFDSHCHLQDQYLPETEGIDSAVELALEEARKSGVIGLVCVGTDAVTSEQALGLSAAAASENSPVGIWATVGLHPHQAKDGISQTIEVLEKALQPGSGLVGIGECGLDYHYDHSDRDVQREVFAQQISLANAHDLTLVIHTRSAWDDTIAVLKSEGVPSRTIIHCFTGGAEEARRCLDLGAYLSFSGISTFKNADDIRDAAVICPAEKLLIETDAPFLAPVPHRGKPNQPAWVAVVGESLAKLRGVAPAELAQSSAAAARRAFQIAT